MVTPQPAKTNQYPISIQNQVKKPDPLLEKEIADLEAMRGASRIKG